jgi:hypothetical protein
MLTQQFALLLFVVLKTLLVGRKLIDFALILIQLPVNAAQLNVQFTNIALGSTQFDGQFGTFVLNAR